ncbi:MAG TPA: energy transducer TonB [Stellaceae bacterium]|nr:energy transducer TonB [Stellaceae bacterium]
MRLDSTRFGAAKKGRSPLSTAQRTETPARSAIARRALGWWTLAASAGLHASVVGLAILLALWSFGPIPEPQPPQKLTLRHEPIAVTLLGPGSQGASGGADGEAAPNALASAPEAPSPEESAAAEALAASPNVAPDPQALPTEAQPPPAPPQTIPPEPAPHPTEMLPAPPPRKPAPPHRQERALATHDVPQPRLRPAPTPAEPQRVAAETPATVQPVAAAPTAGLGGGRAGGAGPGAGATGSRQGTAGAEDGPGDDYLNRLRRWLSKYRYYPEEAKQQKQEGEVVLAFTILHDGTIVDPRVARGSGFPAIDAAALQMLRAASPVPPLPSTFPEAQIGIHIPVTYSLALLDRMF